MKQSVWISGFFPILIFIIILSGCDNSGYNMPAPYVISGTVYTGKTVTGTVHVRTYKRFDAYDAPINSDGSYTISVHKPDPPYLLWADIDGGRTLYSYSSGATDPSPQSPVNSTTASIGVAPEILQQTVDISPLTDLVVGLAYLKDPQARFAAEPNDSFPTSSKISNFQKSIEGLLLNIFTSAGFKDGFDLFHCDLSTPGKTAAYTDAVTALMDYMVFLSVSYPADSHEAILADSVGKIPLYAYDLSGDSKISSKDPQEVLQIIQADQTLSKQP